MQLQQCQANKCLYAKCSAVGGSIGWCENVSDRVWGVNGHGRAWIGFGGKIGKMWAS